MSFSNIKTLTKILFINSFLLTFMSNSLFFFWICFELNMLMFIPLLNKMNQTMSNSLLKYFIIQTISSNIFLICITLIQFSVIYLNMTFYFLFLSLWIKLGFFPFQNWFFQITENMDWMMWFWLNSIQKLIPLWILNLKITSFFYLNLMILLNAIFSSIEMFNQSSFRWMINSSSMNHFSWILLSLNTFSNIWEIYFLIYFILFLNLIYLMKFMNWNSLNNMNFNNFIINSSFIIVMLNFMSMPPFLGFLPKILVIMSINSFFMCLILIFNNIITALIYLKFLSPLLISKTNKNKLNKTLSNPTSSFSFFMFSLIANLVLFI